MSKKKKANITKSSHNDYEIFLKNLRPIALGLTRCSSDLDRRAYRALLEDKRGAKNITAEYEVDEVQPEFFNVTAKFRLTVSDRKKRITPLSIECVFQVHFHGRKPIERSLVEHFTKSELRLLVWPYFRQFVSDLTGRMFIPAITVPLSTETEAAES